MASGPGLGSVADAACAPASSVAAINGPRMLEGELQGALRALRKADSNIVAIHDHMAGDDATFLDADTAGLWTKADSVIRFDDLRITTH